LRNADYLGLKMNLLKERNEFWTSVDW
jgi:hypothetical protein